MHSATRITAFCEAIRSKDGWETKILDEKNSLGLKWAKEAELLQSGYPDTSVELDQRDKQVLEVLRELEAEARRIVHHDLTPMSLDSLQKIQRTYDWEDMHIQAVNAYKYLKASKYGVFPAELSEDVGVFISDDIVPRVVQSALKSELDILANVGPKDLHPGTDGKVQDIIHPSLYPYTLNTTLLANGTRDHPQLKERQTFRSKLVVDAEYTESDADMLYESRFSWIPSIFCVSPDGTSVEIQSYINGLGPRERYPELYKVIEEVFLVAMPLLERSVNHRFSPVDSESVKRWKERRDLRDDPYEPRVQRDRWEQVVKDQQEKKERMRAEKASEKQSRQAERAEEENFLMKFADLALNDEKLVSTFAGKDLRVIVKAANYILKPGQDYEGSWHIEGMPHERIVASAIYYYDTDEAIADDGLSLRRLRIESTDFPEYLEYRHEDFDYILVDKFPNDDKEDDEAYHNDREQDYPSDWEPDWNSDNISRNIVLGTVPTTNFKEGVQSKRDKTGRIISFPNWIQHKVEGLRNSTSRGDTTAHRKILCFFLVDDSLPSPKLERGETVIEYPGFEYRFEPHSVLTTADIPYQACGCNIPTLHIILPLVCRSLTRKALPAELVDLIINSSIETTEHAEFKYQDEAMGMSWRAAEERRRAVMADRRARADKDAEEFVHSYSLCEH